MACTYEQSVNVIIRAPKTVAAVPNFIQNVYAHAKVNTDYELGSIHKYFTY